MTICSRNLKSCMLRFFGKIFQIYQESPQECLSWKSLQFCLISYDLRILDGRWPSKIHNFKWKTILDGRWSQMEHNLQWRTSLNGRQALMDIYQLTIERIKPLTEDNFLWLPFNVKRLPMEENSQWKTTFLKCCPSMEDNLWWKTMFDETQPLLDDNVQ